ncbi:unnamed protein product [Ectocarpus sp. 12 AP-2014]
MGRSPSGPSVSRRRSLKGSSVCWRKISGRRSRGPWRPPGCRSGCRVWGSSWWPQWRFWPWHSNSFGAAGDEMKRWVKALPPTPTTTTATTALSA